MADPEIASQTEDNHDGAAATSIIGGEKSLPGSNRRSGHSFVVELNDKGNTESSLQDAFLKYKKKRQKEIRQHAGQKRKKKHKLKRTNPERMWKLRMKFVEQAKKYFGVPYAKKYWTPDDEEWHSKIFLDCCGLVRQVMRDLRKDFGFSLGPWNQAYMYDTLPITIEREEDMKPGDLVFISAIYYSPKSKKQKHNMTHVEIWLGDGEKTIASRWNKGHVQIFNSYRFEPKAYHSEKYIFKSIDTWLQGICKSFCPIHPWRTRAERFKPSKKSVFAVQDQPQQKDQPAEGSDEDKGPQTVAAGQNALTADANDELRYNENVFNFVHQEQQAKAPPGGGTERNNCPVAAEFGNPWEEQTAALAREEIPEPSLVSQDTFDEMSRSFDQDWLENSEEDDFESVRPSSAWQLALGEQDEETASVSQISLRPDEEDGQSISSSMLPLGDDDTRLLETLCSEVDQLTVKDTKTSQEKSDVPPSRCGNRLLSPIKKVQVDAQEMFTNIGKVKDSKSTRTGRLIPRSANFLQQSQRPRPRLASGRPKPLASQAPKTGPQVLPSLQLKPMKLEKRYKTYVMNSQSGQWTEKLQQQGQTQCDQPGFDIDSFMFGQQGAAAEGNQKEGRAADNQSENKANNKNNSANPTETNTTKPQEKQEAKGGEKSPLGGEKSPEGADGLTTNGVKASKSQSSTKALSANGGLIIKSAGAQGSTNGSGTDRSSTGGTTAVSNEQKKTSERRQSEGGSAPSAPTRQKTAGANKEPTFYIGGGNGVALVEGPLVELGWKRITDKADDSFKLRWVECKSAINYASFKEGDQLVNHIPNGSLLTNKMGLLNSLQAFERVSTSVKKSGPTARLKLTDFLPETYRLDDPKERITFFNVYKEGEIWICKPTGMNQGKGIYLVRSLAEIKKSLQEREEKAASKPHRRTMGRIIQRYIPNPLLIDKRKWDIRTYMLIASTMPYLVLHHQGYVRLSMIEYDNSCENLTAHLTNQFIQKKDPRYKEVKEMTAMSMEKFNEYINENVAEEKGLEADWVYNTLTTRMRQIMTYCFNSVKHKFCRKIGFFDLLGLDFMVDEDMKIWLIEVNVNPCLATNCAALKEVVPGVVKETLNIAIECFEKSRKGQPLQPLKSLKNFHIIHAESGKASGVHRSITASPNRAKSSNPSQQQRSRSLSPQHPPPRTRSLSPVKETQITFSGESAAKPKSTGLAKSTPQATRTTGSTNSGLRGAIPGPYDRSPYSMGVATSDPIRFKMTHAGGAAPPKKKSGSRSDRERGERGS